MIKILQFRKINIKILLKKKIEMFFSSDLQTQTKVKFFHIKVRLPFAPRLLIFLSHQHACPRVKIEEQKERRADCSIKTSKHAKLRASVYVFSTTASRSFIEHIQSMAPFQHMRLQNRY